MSAEKFFELLKKGENIFLTGPAGTGKTFTLKKALEMYPNNFVVTSSTGISALNLMEGARTIHSFSGIGTKNNSDFNNHVKFSWFISGLTNEVVNGILGCKKLIIDEISMIHPDQLDLIDRIFQAVRVDIRPFGGIQMIFAGDALQLPAVQKGADFGTPNSWFFESRSWKMANVKTVQLTEIKRTDNVEFAKMLCRIRTMDFTSEDFKALKSLSNKHLEHEPVKLFATNRKSDEYNQQKLNELTTPLLTIKAKWRGNQDLVKEIKKSVLAQDILNMKVGARVMILVNKSMDFLNDDADYVNGSTGIFLGLETRTTAREHWITERDPVTFEITNIYKDKKTYHVLKIQLDSGPIVFIKRHTWEMGEKIENEHGKLQAEAEYSQYPVRLAWSITVHKSQGMSLDYVDLDCEGIRTDNQFYVAVSRAKTLEGLKVTNLKSMAIKSCPKALDFYRNNI